MRGRDRHDRWRLPDERLAFRSGLELESLPHASTPMDSIYLNATDFETTDAEGAIRPETEDGSEWLSIRAAACVTPDAKEAVLLVRC